MTAPPDEPTGATTAPRGLPVLVLVAATLAVDAAAVHVPGLRLGPLHQVVLLALASSQVGLLAIWAGLGRWSSPWRSAALAAAVVGWPLLLARAGAAVASPVPLLVQTAYLCLMLARRDPDAGTREAPCAHGRTPPRARPPQFSLGNLMGWITNLSVSLGVIQYSLQLHWRFRESPWPTPALCFLGVADGFIALGALRAVAGTGRAAGRIAGALLGFAIACFFVLQVLRDTRWDVVILYLGLHGALVAGSLVAVKLAGYPILRPARRGRFPP